MSMFVFSAPRQAHRGRKRWRFPSLLAVSLLLLCTFQRASAVDSGYRITAYRTDLRIGSDNVYHMNETIAVRFSVPSHGIYRYISTVQEMNWEQAGGRARVYHTKVESVDVPNESFATYRENENLVIRIGDPNQTVTGEKNYTIVYDHALGADQTEDLDFVYYNLIGTDWDCPIEHVSFTVTLPDAFDPASLRFFTGAYQDISSAPADYSVQGNVITGTLDDTLRPGEALTIQLDLPQGYFSVPPSFPWPAFFLIAAAVSALAALILYFLFGRNVPLVETAWYDPPDGITSADAGYLIDTSADDRDVVSLILYWASKNRLSIEQLEKKRFSADKATGVFRGFRRL